METTIQLMSAPPVSAKDFERVRDEIMALVGTLPCSAHTRDEIAPDVHPRWKFQARGWAVSCVATVTDAQDMVAKLKPFHHKRTEAAHLPLDAPVITTPSANLRTYTQKQFDQALKHTPELAQFVEVLAA